MILPFRSQRSQESGTMGVVLSGTRGEEGR